MKNILKIDDYAAVIELDPEANRFRGEFIGLNGGADFYASSIKELMKEGRRSLQIFLKVCDEEGIEPRKHFSGKFILRVDPGVHQAAVIAASSEGKSLNQWAVDVLARAANETAAEYMAIQK